MAKFRISVYERVNTNTNDMKCVFSNVVSSSSVQRSGDDKLYYFRKYKTTHEEKIRWIRESKDRWGDSNYYIADLYDGSSIEKYVCGFSGKYVVYVNKI